MNTATLTAKIAALPDRTRHIVAGVIACNVGPDKSPEWQEIWGMVRDHEARYEWPKARELFCIIGSMGLLTEKMDEALGIYADYGDDVETAAVFRHRYDDTETYVQAADRKRAARRFELCGGAG